MKKKTVLIMLFLIPKITLNADVIDDLIESRVYNTWDLPFYIDIRKNNFVVSPHEAGGSHVPTIMAYQFEDNILYFIIKCSFSSYNDYGSEYDDEIFENIYYSVIIRKDFYGEIKINWIILPKSNLDKHLENYTITNGCISENNLNIRLSPSISGEKYTRQLNKDDIVKIISFKNYSRVNDMFDYWYGINQDNSVLWIYGHYCKFVRQLNIDEIRNNYTRIIELQNIRMHGNDIIMLQNKLLDLNFTEIGDADGYYGPLTEEVIKSIQKYLGFNQNGKVDTFVWCTIFAKENEDILKNVSIVIKYDINDFTKIEIDNSDHHLKYHITKYFFQNELKIMEMNFFEDQTNSIYTYYFINNNYFFIESVYRDEYGNVSRKMFIKDENKTSVLINGETHFTFFDADFFFEY